MKTRHHHTTPLAHAYHVVLTGLVLAITGCGPVDPNGFLPSLPTHAVRDPLFSGNWNVDERQLSRDTFQILLRGKHYRLGGDGEPSEILRRRALELQEFHGYARYKITDYREGIESNTPFTVRVVEAKIVLLDPRFEPPATGSR